MILLLNEHVGIVAELFYQFDDVNLDTGQANEFEAYGRQFGLAAFAF